MTLQKLTDKFLKDFLKAAKKEENADERYSFNFLLPNCIAKSKLIPSYEHQTSALMSMSSFDDNTAKEFFTLRMKGFFDRVLFVTSNLDKIDKDGNYRVSHIKRKQEVIVEEGIKYNSGNIKFIKEDVLYCEEHYFVDNSCNDFSGTFIVKSKEMNIIYGEEVRKEMKPYRINFYNKKGQRIFYIDKNYIFEKEEASFDHYKHIADINSFFSILNYV